MQVMAVIPALDAERSVGSVVRELVALAGEAGVALPVVVVDDGSRDATAEVAGRAGAQVVRHPSNRGKGAALRTGLRVCLDAGAPAMVTLDADGQHPPAEALRLALHPAPAEALLLGVRDLRGAGAPGASRFSNALSNAFLSAFARRRFGDTQCGLRRYPTHGLQALGCRATGYAFEAEAVLRAALAGWTILDVPTRVHYPPPAERVSHFHVVKDPARIVATVVAVMLSAPRAR